ncbi:type I secretion system permease/ATPase [Frigidibacter sp. MR17.24]|uniref:type I secretion system permease/ATPase n=1 Tax=Frigidibacter sp. MR17.24 TaxID=3127345 RepID=UPI003012B1AF
MSHPALEGSPYRRAISAIRPALWMAAVFSAAINLLMLTGSVYMLQVYDRVIPSGSVPTLVGLFAAVLLCYGFLGLYDLLRLRLLSRAGYRFERALDRAAFAGSIGAEGSDEAEAGRRRLALRDLATLRAFLGGPAMPGLLDLPWIPLYLGMLFLLHPLLGWLTVAGAGVGLAFALAGQLLARAPGQRAARAETQAELFAEQARGNRELVVALGLADRLTSVWAGHQSAAQAANQAGAERAEMLSAASRSFRMLLQSALLTLGAYLAITQEISSGAIVASSILSGRALAPADQVVGQWRALARARDARRRLMATFGRAAPAARAMDLPAPTGAITVSRLTKLAPAAHAGQGVAERARLLEGLAFSIEPGTVLAVIGPSASGKSSLARVLTGIWSADIGEIRLDGATPEQWDPETLGRHLGYLPQVVTLLPGTVRDNIARFDPWLEDAAVIAAAKLAGVHEMILALPQGYETRVGGAEVPLSGGQIQRLGLARAIVGRPRILVLDEPNANLDQEGDAALAHVISTLAAAGSTVVVMAHRPSVLAVASHVMVLNQGRIAQFGRRDEVLGARPQAVPSTGPSAVASAGPATAPSAKPQAVAGRALGPRAPAASAAPVAAQAVAPAPAPAKPIPALVAAPKPAPDQLLNQAGDAAGSEPISFALVERARRVNASKPSAPRPEPVTEWEWDAQEDRDSTAAAAADPVRLRKEA